MPTSCPDRVCLFLHNIINAHIIQTSLEDVEQVIAFIHRKIGLGGLEVGSKWAYAAHIKPTSSPLDDCRPMQQYWQGWILRNTVLLIG